MKLLFALDYIYFPVQTSYMYTQKKCRFRIFLKAPRCNSHALGMQTGLFFLAPMTEHLIAFSSFVAAPLEGSL